MKDKDLILLARKAYQNAYAPYSRAKVGAALLTKNGKVFTGCNIENASYGLTICAERVAVANAINNGEKKFTKIAISTNQKREFSPCGACRQVLAEFSPRIQVIWLAETGRIRTRNLKQLLPAAFKKWKNIAQL